jgi:hypothetical protein
VLAVGRRAFVNAPSDASGTVLLTDDHGARSDSALRDGTEVEITGWRPRGANGTRYRVCDRSGGSDGWIAAEELRTTATRPPSDGATPPPATDPRGRRFGSAF